MAIAREAVVQIQDFTEQNLSNTCWAFVPCQKKGQGEAKAKPWDMGDVSEIGLVRNPRD